MNQNILTFCFPFSVGTRGAALVRLVEEVCKVNGLTGRPAKLGPHATVIPPFYCSDRERKAIATLTRHMWKFNGKEVDVRATSLNVFAPESPGKDSALYIKVRMDGEYRDFVERHKLDWPFEFVHLPAQTNPVDRVWVPHISVIEGPGLYEKATPLLHRISEDCVYDKVVTLGEPLFFEKKKVGDTVRWFPVLV